MKPGRRQLLFSAALLGLSQAGMSASPSLPELVKRSKPSVVLVGTFLETDTPRFQFRGTGFVVGDGLSIVTNAHVLPEATDVVPGRELMVQIWQGGTRWEARLAKVEGLSRAHDLAWLRIGGAPAPALSLADGAQLAEGSEVAFLGFPIGGALGFSHVTHRGIVSSITQLSPPQANARNLNPAAIRQLRESSVDIYQLDAVAYPGNSGGPVLDPASGKVVGVINMVLTKAGREGALSAPSGIAYAIPVVRVHELLKR